MAFKSIFTALISLQILTAAVGAVREEEETNHCPNQGKAENGGWRLNTKDDFKRCILDCKEGYSPSGCHVIRKDRYGDWNHNISSCVEAEWFNKKKVACYTAIVAAIAASPYLLSILGFKAVGIAGGSLAAKWMAYIGIVSQGSSFALLQSVGMAGISKAAILKALGSGAAVCDGVIYILSDNPCETE
ncbi:uncharacterized protein LOC132726801 [Ruditapes philippinarum]|uniref:uncharacterized protein LOC132726801 n=1 Tax=Ruditapes philippinarum TaxID=129788 RepID=UPI00295B271A|nr:uncharacterized protein LOC132726801 [Ruditapes philippinarum]